MGLAVRLERPAGRRLKVVNYLMDRQIARDFRKWLIQLSPEMKWRWAYQQLVYRKLHAIDRRECARLMVFLPPRHGKSELVTVRYAAWRLERDPRTRIIIGSYNQKLANRFSRKIRETVGSDRGDEGDGNGRRRKASGWCSSRQKAAADEWETTAGGGVKAVGVGAGVTGFGRTL